MIKVENQYTGKVILEVETLIDANLSGADLREAYLNDSNLRRANLSGANLSGAHLKRADLGSVNLKGANLRGANLRYVNLSNADLKYADLRGANVRYVDFWGAVNYYSFVAYDTSKRLVHCVKHHDTWMVLAGCFWGTLEELERKVLNTHKSPVYLANIEILKTI